MTSAADAAPVPHFLHVFASFDKGGKEVRAARIINRFGTGARHTILSADPRAMAARSLIDPEVGAVFPEDGPQLTGRPSVRRWRAIARYLAGFDCVLTYNWGAMDAVMAHGLFARSMGLPALVHHEDGFNADEARGLKWHRNLFRTVALARAHTLVVPSQQLEAIALKAWSQPRARVHRIPNGIAVARFGGRFGGSIAGTDKPPGEIWVGTLAGLRPVKNLPMLVEAFARSGIAGRLVIVGEGPERAAIAAEAQRRGIADRLLLPGHADDPAEPLGLFDIFALSSDSEQFPIALAEAMATGLPVAATRVGDVAAMLAPENLPLLCEPGDTAALAGHLATLGADASLRAGIGAANRARAVEQLDEEAMFDRYLALYNAALAAHGGIGRRSAAVQAPSGTPRAATGRGNAKAVGKARRRR